MATVLFNAELFRGLFPAYSNPVQFTDVILQYQWDMAAGYITDSTVVACYAGMTRGQQVSALNLMTAHLVALNQAAAAGDAGGVVTGATIDKVSVQLQPPPEANQWQWWLNQTPYGQQLLALLQIASAGGRFYSAGVPVVSAFRRW